MTLLRSSAVSIHGFDPKTEPLFRIVGSAGCDTNAHLSVCLIITLSRVFQYSLLVIFTISSLFFFLCYYQYSLLLIFTISYLFFFLCYCQYSLLLIVTISSLFFFLCYCQYFSSIIKSTCVSIINFNHHQWASKELKPMFISMFIFPTIFSFSSFYFYFIFLFFFSISHTFLLNTTNLLKIITNDTFSSSLNSYSKFCYFYNNFYYFLILFIIILF